MNVERGLKSINALLAHIPDSVSIPSTYIFLNDGGMIAQWESTSRMVEVVIQNTDVNMRAISFCGGEISIVTRQNSPTIGKDFVGLMFPFFQEPIYDDDEE